MSLNEVVNKVGGELVGGRIVAVVDGQRVYLSEPGGFLNELGHRILAEREAEAAPAPVKKGRKAAIEE